MSSDSLRRFTPKPEHLVLFQEMQDLIGRHAGEMSAEQMLAVAANMVGKLTAFVDAPRDELVKVICANISAGNKEVIDLLYKTEGNA